MFFSYEKKFDIILSCLAYSETQFGIFCLCGLGNTAAAVRSHFVCFEKAGNFQLVAKLRPSAARQVISFMVLNMSRFKPKKL